MHLTIAFITGRQEPRFDWFFSSLSNQVTVDDDFEIVIVDFFAQAVDDWTWEQATKRKTDTYELGFKHGFDAIRVTPPKPCVWQGPNRLTKVNWWAISNARNTAICLAKDGYIVFSDDRGIFMPGWMNGVREAKGVPYVLAGGYKKVANLEVEHGLLKSHGEVLGIDCRYKGQLGPVGCGGEWVYGCGTGVPIDWALEINGYDEDNDGLGYEDVYFGLMLEKHGYPIRYDPRVMLMEERMHPGGIGPHFRREDPGMAPWNKSHSMLNMIRHGGRHKSPNYFGPEGIRGLRRKIQAGEPFPLCGIPEHEWWTGCSLKHLNDGPIHR